MRRQSQHQSVAYTMTTSSDIINPYPNLTWHLGTIGFSYDDWRGLFYPTGTKPSNYLTHYSRIFNSVEIDSTFHAIPKVEVVRRWAESTPDEFCFALKMLQQITHQPDLNGQRRALAEFISVARVLGAKLGPILIQFPPSFRAEQAEILRKFLAELPTDLRFAVEVRHQSWYTRKADGEPMLVDLLRESNVCWAATEYPGLPVNIWRTADFTYIRWIGRNGSFAHHTHEQLDRSRELAGWKELIGVNLGWLEEIYGFFNNDYAGFAPGTANRFKEVMGLPLERFEPPVQGKLF